MTNFWVKISLSFLLLGFGVLLFTSILENSPTTDEPPHILSGYVALKYGENFIDPEHPLLIKILATSPLLLQNLDFNYNDPNYVSQKTQFSISRMFKAARDFLNYGNNNPDKIMLLTRIPMIALTVFFGLVIFLFANKLFDTKVALLATFLYATEPIVLANGPLVNTDTAAAGFIISTVYTLYLYSERQSTKRLAFLTLTLTAALLTKFSAFYLIPIVLFTMGFIFWRQRKFRWKHMLFLPLASLVMLAFFYGAISFRTQGWYAFLPTQFFEGLSIVFTQVSSSERFSYLMGETYYGSRWYYFPILIATKTQLLTLLGSIFGFFFLWKMRLKLNTKQLVIFFTPLVIFFTLSLVAKFNIGIRHILPLYPFLFILAAGGFIALLYYLKTKTSLVAVSFLVLLLLIGGRFWSLGTTYPHFLSYYNLLVGGTDNGWKVTNDSNYDWGQDVKRLAKYVAENNIRSIAFDNYSGNYAAAYYDIPVSEITPADTDYKGYLALSTSVITYHEDREFNYSWVVDNYQPIDRAGKSIFIYRID